jgi:hypothetical protein
LRTKSWRFLSRSFELKFHGQGRPNVCGLQE